jgi:hypothetical protein
VEETGQTDRKLQYTNANANFADHGFRQQIETSQTEEELKL